MPSVPDHPKIVALPRLLLLLAQRRKDATIVFTNGCFDLLHAGHADLLTRAKALGDILIVGLNTDESVTRLKGPHGRSPLSTSGPLSWPAWPVRTLSPPLPKIPLSTSSPPSSPIFWSKGAIGLPRPSWAGTSSWREAAASKASPCFRHLHYRHHRPRPRRK